MSRGTITGRTLVLSLLLLSACQSPEEAVERADREAYAIIAEKQQALLGTTPAFSVDPPEDRAMDRYVDPETGLARPGAVLQLSLETVLDIAARNSRTFQAEKERLFGAALALIIAREDFRGSPFALAEGDLTSSNGTESVSASNSFGVTRLFERGGSFALSLGLDFLRFVSSPTSEDLSSSALLTIDLPLLRNAGREIAMENLTQADRDALYALRSFERFKQVYAVRVTSSYLRLLAQAQQVVNEEASLETIRLTRREAEAKFEEGRFPLVEVDQQRQQELRAENRLVLARENFDRALDGLKELLGLPVDLVIELSLEDIQGLGELVELSRVDIEVEEATRRALLGRLDLRNAVDGVGDAERDVVIAEDQLRPTLDLVLSAAPRSASNRPLDYDLDSGTYSAGLVTDLALDKDVQSVALRSSLIGLEAALRTQEQEIENVKLDVREAVRALRQARLSLVIAERSVELAEKRVAATRDLLSEGRVPSRDFLEAQDALVANQNTLIDTQVDFRIAFLELLRDTGALVVQPEGLSYEAARESLLGD